MNCITLLFKAEIRVTLLKWLLNEAWMHTQAMLLMSSSLTTFSFK